MCHDCGALEREISQACGQRGWDDIDDEILYFRVEGLKSRLYRLWDKHYAERERLMKDLSWRED